MVRKKDVRKGCSEKIIHAGKKGCVTLFDAKRYDASANNIVI